MFCIFPIYIFKDLYIIHLHIYILTFIFVRSRPQNQRQPLWTYTTLPTYWNQVIGNNRKGYVFWRAIKGCHKIRLGLVWKMYEPRIVLKDEGGISRIRCLLFLEGFRKFSVFIYFQLYITPFYLILSGVREENYSSTLPTYYDYSHNLGSVNITIGTRLLSPNTSFRTITIVTVLNNTHFDHWNL